MDGLSVIGDIASIMSVFMLAYIILLLELKGKKDNTPPIVPKPTPKPTARQSIPTPDPMPEPEPDPRSLKKIVLRRFKRESGKSSPTSNEINDQMECCTNSKPVAPRPISEPTPKPIPMPTPRPIEPTPKPVQPPPPTTRICPNGVKYTVKRIPETPIPETEEEKELRIKGFVPDNGMDEQIRVRQMEIFKNNFEQEMKDALQWP